MDARDIERTEDGLPVIAYRLPLRWLFESATISHGFAVKEQNFGSTSRVTERAELLRQRDAVCPELSLPQWWLASPARQNRCSNKDVVRILKYGEGKPVWVRFR